MAKTTNTANSREKANQITRQTSDKVCSRCGRAQAVIRYC